MASTTLCEHLRRNSLNPVDASDASEDFDGDIKSNLEAYRDGTDPEVP
jgi:hypothetical protein